MDMNSVNVEAIVKQVLEGMLDKQEAPTTTIAAPTANGAIPKTAKVAMLTALEHYEIMIGNNRKVNILKWFR